MLCNQMRILLVTCVFLLPAAAFGQDLGGAKVEVREQQPYGQYLTDADGRALYMFTADKAGESSC